MCGICGFVSKSKITLETLKSMNDTMVHRGPDDEGEEILPFNGDSVLGMAQRRLSIVDLSEKGHQPFHSKEDDIVLVFNGEIYNFLDLKEELVGYQFVSDCDTEVVMAAYQKWGMNFVHHLDGMFAIALYDKKRKKLILARDRIGKKPLYYYQNNNSFVFGSVLKAVMEFPEFEKKINKDVIPRYLYNRYIAEEDCIFHNTYKVRPGEMIVFDGITCKKNFYWNLLDMYVEGKKCSFKDYNQAKEQLKKKLISSVKRRMIADVPVGTFLSGGFDSSLVTAVAQTLSKTPLKTFSIGFEDEAFDEAPYAEAIAMHLGTEHTNHYVTEDEMLKLVESIPQYYDEPFADSSQIPSMLVAEIAKKEVTVVLTGDGGDEFFCGYNMYDKLYIAENIEPIAKFLRLFTCDRKTILERLPFSVRAILENNKREYKTQFGRKSYEENIGKMFDFPIKTLPYNEEKIPERKWQVRRMLLDCITYLPDNNLCKVDRATMKHSLEARNPLLDISFIETAFKTPQKFKYFKRDKKHILKDLAYDYIPVELLDRPKKGFAVPIDSWLRGPLKEDLLKLTSESYLREQGIFNSNFTSEYVQAYVQQGDKGAFSGQNPSNIIWPLYIFQKWYQYYIK